MASVIFNDQTVDLSPGHTLFDAADAAGVKVPTSCGRDGSCHECLIRVDSGADSLSEPTEKESFLSEPYRLACQASLSSAQSEENGQVVAHTFSRRPQILTSSAPVDVELSPRTRHRGDNVVRDGKVIDTYRGGIYGLAIDVGTTTVVANLVDLESGERLHTAAFENPQSFAGSNILHRIDYDTTESHAGELRKILLGHLNNEIRQMPCDRVQIYEAVLTGNATMRDLVFGLDLTTIGQKPFKSLTEHALLSGEAETTSIDVSPKESGILMNRHGSVYGAPLIACHVGADTATAILATGMHRSDEICLLLDIGTNTEIVVGNRDRMIAASSPAGPAFEGGSIRSGMPGMEGAIERVWWSEGSLEYSVIGDVAPVGICGSGLVDALAVLREEEILDTIGRFEDGSDSYVISETPRVCLSRKDISELSQAKAATYAGQRILLRSMGLTFDDVSHVYIAGGFANFIDLDNAMAIGLIPPFAKERVEKVGNASLEGASHVLVSDEKRREIEGLVKGIEHVELEEESDFFDIYVEGCFLEPMTLSI